MENNNNKQKPSQLEEIMSVISDDIDVKDEDRRELGAESIIKAYKAIKNYRLYSEILSDLEYLENKYKDNMNERIEETLEKGKKLIREFKLTLERVRLNDRDAKLDINVDDDSLIEILKIGKIRSYDLHSKCLHISELLNLLEEKTRSKLENKTIKHLNDILKEYKDVGVHETREIEEKERKGKGKQIDNVMWL